MVQETTTLEDRSFWSRGWGLGIARLLAGAVGLVLIIAALLKAPEMDLFVRQIKAYGIISHPFLLLLGAWLLILTEITLGTALLISYRLTIIIPIVTFLFLVFLGANIWAWFTNITEDCGCFGTWLVRTPGEALIEDIILVIALFPAWLGLRYSNADKSRIKKGSVIVACLVGMIIPITFSGLPSSWVSTPQIKTLEAEIKNLEVQGLKGIDLEEGDYLIALMLTDCDHCQEAVPELNELSEQAGLPRIIALSPNNGEQRKAFIEIFGASYPVGQVDLRIFLRLLGDQDVPRYLLIQDGRLLHIWDELIPNTDDIMQIF